MNFEYSPYSLPLIVSALVSVWTIFHVLSRRNARGVVSLIVISGGVFIWAVGYALEIAGADLATKLFWGKVQYFGIVSIPVAWLCFAVSHADSSFQWTPRKVGLLSVLPAITLVLALTTEMHGLIWKEYSTFHEGALSGLEITHGAWFWVHWAYSQLLVFAGTFVVVRNLIRTRGAFRGQSAVLLIAVLIPWIGNILYVLNLSPFPKLDLTPFSFTISIAALMWAIYGFRLVDIAPVARDLIFDSIQDGIVVFDMSKRAVDINKAACYITGLSEAYVIGRRVEDVFEMWPHIVENFDNLTELVEEVSAGVGEAERRYEIGAKAVRNARGDVFGYAVTIRASAHVSRSYTTTYASKAETDAQARLISTAHDSSVSQQQPMNWIVDFFKVPPKADIDVPVGENRSWHQVRERALTTIARVIALIGGTVFLFNVLSSIESMPSSMVWAYGFVFMLVWGISLARDIAYRPRLLVLFLALYFFAVAEVINYGSVAESLTFFLTFFAATAVLGSPRSSMAALFLSLGTLGAFVWLNYVGIFIPLNGNASTVSFTMKPGIISMLEFFVNASIIIISGTFLMKDLRFAWQLETQSYNLMQQERNLLEQRIKERTGELATARDEAEKVADEMRKYYLAIEQSGNSIVITDIDGAIEYVNPGFSAFSGYAPEEVIGQTPSILKSGEHDAAFYEDMWGTISSGRTWYGKFHNKRKDGSLYWESATIAPVQNRFGEITNYIAIKEDITDQKFIQDQLAQQNNYLSILHQITLDLLHRRDLSSLLKIVVDYSAILLDAPFSELMLEEKGLLVIHATTNNQSHLKGTRFSRNEARLSWKAFDTQQPVMLDDYASWQQRNVIHDNNIHATMDLPILVGDRCIGVLALGRTQEEYTFTPEQVQTGILFSRLTALVLDNTNLYDAARREIAERERLEDALLSQNHYLSVLQKIMFSLLQNADEKNLWDDIVKEAVGLVNAPCGYIFILDEDDLVLQAAIAGAKSPREMRENKDSDGVLGWVWKHQRTLVVDDYSTWKERDPSYSKWNMKSLVGIPLIGRTGPFGVLIVAYGSEDARPFTPQEIDIFGQFGALASLVLDNAQLYIQAQSELTERERAEILLRESETRFRQIVESAGDIIYRTDGAGNFVYVNPTALVVMGYQSEDEVLGRNYLELVIPEWRDDVRKFYENQFISGKEGSYFEFPAVNAHGEIIWFGQNVQLIREHDAIVGVQSVARDITKLKQTQDALAVSRDQALDASRFKSQLLSRVSHELRTPLNGILGYAELLQYEAFGKLNEKQKNAVTNVVESTHYLTHIVNDLLDQAQMESKSITLHYENFSPERMLDNISTTISVLANRKGLQFHAELLPGVPAEVYGDVNRLKQVIINLAGNAIKFTKEGEVRVVVEPAQPGYWAVEVRDTGVGIPPAEQETIFEPFRQVNNAITRENRGSGLGLAITKQLIELMGGRIVLESEMGKGSAFIVTLPVGNAPQE